MYKVAKNDKFLSDVRRKRATCLVDVHVEVRSDGHQPLVTDSCVEPRFVCGCGVMVGYCSGRPRDACVGEFHPRANLSCRPMAVLLGAIADPGRLYRSVRRSAERGYDCRALELGGVGVGSRCECGTAVAILWRGHLSHTSDTFAR